MQKIIAIGNHSIITTMNYVSETHISLDDCFFTTDDKNFLEIIYQGFSTNIINNYTLLPKNFYKLCQNENEEYVTVYRKICDLLAGVDKLIVLANTKTDYTTLCNVISEIVVQYDLPCSFLFKQSGENSLANVSQIVSSFIRLSEVTGTSSKKSDKQYYDTVKALQDKCMSDDGRVFLFSN